MAENGTPEPRTERVEVAFNVSGPGRVETWQGREFRVVPATLIKEQVLHNNLGKMYLPADVITQAWAETFDDAPVLIDHPTTRGSESTGRSPEVQNEMGVGRVFHSKAENASLKAEVWIDLARAKSVADLATILGDLDNGKTVELSTGFPAKLVAENGNFGGKPFDIRVTDAGPGDHLAIFATKQGACSIKDGCGLAANHAGDCDCKDAPKDIPALQAWWQKAFSEFKAALSSKHPQTDVTPPGEGDPPDNTGDGNMATRQEMIANLARTGADVEELGKLDDATLTALANAKAAPPEGDGWRKAGEWREKYERLHEETKNAVALEGTERADLLDDLLFKAANGRVPWGEDELKAMALPDLKKAHQAVFPPTNDYSMLGAPRNSDSGRKFRAKGILTTRNSVFDDDRKEA